MNHWQDCEVPAMRLEAHFGDRLVRCFVDRPASVQAMFNAAIERHGGRDALVFEGRRWTWQGLDEVSGRVAAGLAARGIGAGDRVAILIGNRPEFVFTFYAAMRLGAIAVPISVREQAPGIAYMLGHCGARAVVVEAGLAARLPERAICPALSVRIVVEDAGPDGFDALLSRPGRVDAAPSTEADTALILYTSGTTGRPKGAMLTHFNIVHSALHFRACMRLDHSDRSALAVPASHVTGLVAIIATMLCVGGAVVMLREFKAAAFIAEVARERVTQTILVPAMYALVLMAPELQAHDLSAWRVGGYGGAPMPVATIDALAVHLPRLTLTNAYGATETTSPATCMPPGLTREHADTVGVAVPCAQILVVDDAGREVPCGATGELWIGGPMVVKGYWDNAAATASEFTAGFWHSGDLGSIDAQGYVRIFDRKKDMLNRGGHKIYSVEVENTLVGVPGVVEAAVVGQPCPVLGERVHAFVHAPGTVLTEAQLRAHCAAALADYKVPESITFSDAPLPRNANGKLMKRLLREALPAR